AAADPQTLGKKEEQEPCGDALRKVEAEAAKAGKAMGHLERGDLYQSTRRRSRSRKYESRSEERLSGDRLRSRLVDDDPNCIVGDQADSAIVWIGGCSLSADRVATYLARRAVG